MLLAIETSVGAGSIALLENGEEICSYVFGKSEPLSRNLLLEIQNLLNKSGTAKDQIEYVAISNGPGSLTGIRVGVSVGLGISDACQAQCVGISLTEALRDSSLQNEVYVVLPAGKNQFYVQYFEGERAGEIVVIKQDNLSGEFCNPQKMLMVESSLFDAFENSDLVNERVYSTPNLASLIGQAALKKIESNNLSRPSPIYLQGNYFQKTNE